MNRVSAVNRERTQKYEHATLCSHTLDNTAAAAEDAGRPSAASSWFRDFPTRARTWSAFCNLGPRSVSLVYIVLFSLHRHPSANRLSQPRDNLRGQSEAFPKAVDVGEVRIVTAVARCPIHPVAD